MHIGKYNILRRSWSLVQVLFSPSSLSSSSSSSFSSSCRIALYSTTTTAAGVGGNRIPAPNMTRKQNKILVLTKEGLETYQTIFTRRLDLPIIKDDNDTSTAAPTSTSDIILYTSSPPDLDIASQYNIWFGSPSMIAPLLQQQQQYNSCTPSSESTSSNKLPDWVQSTWAGVEPFLKPDMPQRGYVLTNMRGIFGEQIAEYAVGHIMSHCLNVPQHMTNSATTCSWTPTLWLPQRVKGKTVGILGVGDIGQQVARLCKLLGMTVYGYTRSSTDCEYVDQYYHTTEDLQHVMAPLIDYWINVMPNTPHTQNVLCKAILDQMKHGTVIINAGRGNAICDEDLMEALESSKVDYAVLDVVRNEPPSPEYMFWKHPRVLLTSHTAAITDPEGAAQVFLENYQRFCEGTELNYVVDFERGY